MQMLSTNRFALKEWAAVCDRLARGEVLVLLRKGGLREPGFRPEHCEFFLFPTRFHEQGRPPAEAVELELYAEAVDDLLVRDLERLRRLEGMHALAWEDVEKRFRYREPGLHALVLRAWRLARPQRVENARAYDGCVSWVELEEARDVELDAPAIAEDDFKRRRDAVRAALDA